MSYIDSNLLTGESVIYRARLHWIVFLWPIIWLIVAILLFGAGEGAAGLGVIALILFIATGIGSLVSYVTSEFGVTTKRVLVKVGFIRRNSLEILLNKVESIQVHQGILGRILSFGTVRVCGTGGSREPFHKISSPLQLRRAAQEQIASVQDSK